MRKKMKFLVCAGFDLVDRDTQSIMNNINNVVVCGFCRSEYGLWYSIPIK